jgi:hypothetical protein
MNTTLEQHEAHAVLTCTPAQAKVESLIDMMKGLPTVIEMPLVHRFTPGMYIREIHMPKGALVVSRIHRTEHPYVISKGRVVVWVENVGMVRLQAPYTGITQPGTRRVLYILEDCIWTTFHATDKTNPDEIVNDVTYERFDGSEMSPETLEEIKRV